MDTTLTTLDNNYDTMTKLDKRAKFVELRASGQSLRAIAEELHTAKSTLSLWEHELKADIAQYRAERLQEVYNQYGVLKEARVKALGTALQNIDKELGKRNLEDVSTDKLLDYKLKYTAALSDEYVSISLRDKIEPNLDTKTILTRIDDLYSRVRNGETTKEQAATELVVLTGLMRVYENSELEERVNKLQRAIAL
jgi:transcriptional regulator with XRE-family HTH domain